MLRITSEVLWKIRFGYYVPNKRVESAVWKHALIRGVATGSLIRPDDGLASDCG